MKTTGIFLAAALLLVFAGNSSCNKIKKDKGIIGSEIAFPICFQPENSSNEWVITSQDDYCYSQMSS